MLLTVVTGTVPRAVRAAFSTRRWSLLAAASFRSSNFARICGIFPSETLRLTLSPETSRELSTSVKNSATSELFHVMHCNFNDGSLYALLYVNYREVAGLIVYVLLHFWVITHQNVES